MIRNTRGVNSIAVYMAVNWVVSHQVIASPGSGKKETDSE
jgi:hypothetical protein